MTVRVSSIAAAVVLLTMAIGAAAQEPRAVFRSVVGAVSVTVSVRSGNKPVTGLTARDFQLLDNGVPQNVSAISVETLPIDVTLLLDVSRSVAGPRLEQLKQGVTETAGYLGPADRLRLIAMQHELRQVFPFQPGGIKPPLEGLRALGGTALFDALAVAMMRSAEVDRRQLIVAYTDGVDTISILGPDDVREIAAHADAVVYILAPRGTSPARPESSGSAARLGELADRTGGLLFWIDARASTTGAFKDAIAEFRTAYVLRYVPAGVAKPGWHEIAVRVTSGNYDVRARKGYSLTK